MQPSNKIAFVPLRVQADPFLAGRHPCHDHRLITAGPGDIADEDWESNPQNFIVAKMTDCFHQKEWAELLASAPRLLEENRALRAELEKTKNCINAILSNVSLYGHESLEIKAREIVMDARAALSRGKDGK